MFSSQAAGNEKMKGLVNFIAEIRKCKTPAEEVTRVKKELDNIKSKCTGAGAAKVDAYNRKKYTWKLLLIHMLGYEVGVHDGGDLHEVMQLFMTMVASKSYQEKAVGYLACAVFMQGRDDLLRMIIHSCKNDLAHVSNEVQSLALITIANVGTAEFAEILSTDVFKLLTTTEHDAIKKKAALCLLNLVRRAPDAAIQTDENRKVFALLRDSNVGVLVSTAALIKGMLAQARADDNLNEYAAVVPETINIIRKLVVDKPKDMAKWGYWLTISPWLQIKCLDILAFFDPPADSALNDALKESINAIVHETKVTKNVSKNNADHGILFHAYNLVLHYTHTGKGDWDGVAEEIITKCMKFIGVKSANIRFVALDVMRRVFRIPGFNSIKAKVMKIVVPQLKDDDSAIRAQVAKLLFALSDDSNTAAVAESLIDALQSERSVDKDEAAYERDRQRRRKAHAAAAAGEAVPDDEDFADEVDADTSRDKNLNQRMLKLKHSLSGSVSDDACFDYIQFEKFSISRRVAVLAEKAAFSLDGGSGEQYLDLMIKKLCLMPTGYVPQDVFIRACYVISQHQELQKAAVTTAFEMLSDDSINTNDLGIRMTAYIVGTYADQISDRTHDIVELFHKRLDPEHASPDTRAIILQSLSHLAGDEASAVMKRHKHVAKPAIHAKYESDIKAIGAGADDNKDSEDETKVKVLEYMGKDIAQYFKEYNLYDHNSKSKRSAARKKQQPPPPKSPPPAEAKAKFADILDLHIPTGEEKELEEEWNDFQKFKEQVNSLTKENFAPHWRKIKDRGTTAKDSGAIGSSDDHPDVYVLPTGETLDVEEFGASRQSIMEAAQADKHEAAHNDDIWSEMENAAKADATSGDDWVSFGD